MKEFEKIRMSLLPNVTEDFDVVKETLNNGLFLLRFKDTEAPKVKIVQAWNSSKEVQRLEFTVTRENREIDAAVLIARSSHNYFIVSGFTDNAIYMEKFATTEQVNNFLSAYFVKRILKAETP